MSDFRVYRNVRRFSCVTPHTPTNSPVIEYYTPNNNKTNKNNSKSLFGSAKSDKFLNINYYKSPLRYSAGCFLQRERLRFRHRFFVRSPRTPLYKRCQIIKKKLNFDIEDDSESGGLQIDAPQNSHKIQNRPLDIPRISFTSPHQKTEYRNVVTENHIDLKAPELNFMTPNKLRITQNLSYNMDTCKVLGRGRYGSVVEETYKGDKVAVKIIDLRKKRLKDCLKSEQNGLGLDHKNVVKMYFILQPRNVSINHSALVIMERVNNANDLQTIMDSDYGDAFLTPQRITRYTIDICEGLNYIHARKILHLDVKPKNILVCPDEVCKLCDFGTSLSLDYKIKWNLNELLYQFRGTIHYCSPEILCGFTPTAASDVYSLGITMWQLMHRTIPYGTSLREESLIYQVVKNNLRPKITKRANFFEKFYSEMYETCWAKGTSQRCNINFILNRLYEYRYSCVPLWQK